MRHLPIEDYIGIRLAFGVSYFGQLAREDLADGYGVDADRALEARSALADRVASSPEPVRQAARRAMEYLP